MNNLTRSAIAALAMSAAVLSAEDFKRTLHTGPAPHVSVNTGSGYVHIMSADISEVQVTGHVRKGGGNWGWSGGGNVEERIRSIVANPPIEQNGDNIVIGRMRDRDAQRNINIDYDVLIPRKASAEGRSGSGDVRAANLDGAFSGGSGSGDLEVVNAHSSVRLDTGSGSVRAREIYGPAVLKSGSGDIELQQVAAGDVLAETGSGSIRLRGVKGALRATTGSGDVEAQGATAGDWRITTGSGSVRLDLGRQASFHIDASTGSGDIRLAQMTGTDTQMNHHHLSTTVNGGGPAVRIQTGSGDIEVR